MGENKNTQSFKDEFETEWKKNDHDCCIMVSMVISLIIYMGLIMGIFCSLKPKTLFFFIIELCVMVLITLMTFLWLRFLSRIYLEIQQEKKRLMNMKMDAYNSLIEARVKKEKKIYEPKSDEGKDNKQCDLELSKLELELTEVNCKLKGKECELAEIERELQEAKPKANTGSQTGQNNSQTDQNTSQTDQNKKS
jgi:hypothetical protein